MLIAQITDIHLGFDPENPAEFNRRRVDKVIQALADMDRKPDLMFATGDLVDRGDIDSYRRLRQAIAGCPFPVHLCVGNHDYRDAFRAVFPNVPTVDGFIQYEVDAGPVRCLVLDTLEDGRHGGGFCEIRAAWLRARLAEQPDRPTLLVLHHPPIETGIGWMTTDPEERWVAMLDAAIGRDANIVGMTCGHIHRSIVTNWRGRTVMVCASTAPQVALTLAPIDANRPDGRPMIVADPPAYALHYWNGEGLITHFDNADEHVTLARYDVTMQPLVESLVEERTPPRPPLMRIATA